MFVIWCDYIHVKSMLMYGSRALYVCRVQDTLSNFKNLILPKIHMLDGWWITSGNTWAIAESVVSLAVEPSSQVHVPSSSFNSGSRRSTEVPPQLTIMRPPHLSFCLSSCHAFTCHRWWISKMMLITCLFLTRTVTTDPMWFSFKEKHLYITEGRAQVAA